MAQIDVLSKIEEALPEHEFEDTKVSGKLGAGEFMSNDHSFSKGRVSTDIEQIENPEI